MRAQALLPFPSPIPPISAPVDDLPGHPGLNQLVVHAQVKDDKDLGGKCLRSQDSGRTWVADPLIVQAQVKHDPHLQGRVLRVQIVSTG